MPEVLYEEVIEVDERVVLQQDSCQLELKSPLVQGSTGEKVLILYVTPELARHWGNFHPINS